MNIDKLKYHDTSNNEGVWLDLGEGASIRVRRWSCPKFKSVLETLHADLPGDLSTVTAEKATEINEIIRREVATHIVTDWKGFTKDGEKFEYSLERSLETIGNPAYEQLHDLVVEFSQKNDNYLSETVDRLEKHS